MRKALILAALLGAMVIGTVSHAQEPAALERLRTITVSGDARVYVKPDEVILVFGVSEESRELAEAKSNADKTSKQIVAAIRQSGVEEKDIQTDNLQIFTRTEDYSKSSSRRLTFTVTKSYRVKLRDAQKVEALYDAAVAAGANSVQGPTYQTSELRKYRDQAREMALLAAKEKAMAMANTLRVSVGNVRTISEGAGGVYIPMVANRFANAQMQQSAFSEPADEREASTPLGQIEVSAQVQVVFDLQMTN